MLGVLDALFYHLPVSMRVILPFVAMKSMSKRWKKLHTRTARDLNSQRSFAKLALLFFNPSKVLPYLYGKASTETAGKIAFITFHASTVPSTIKTRTVQLHTMSTTTTGRLPSDARIMASSPEWQVPTVLPQCR